MQQSQEITEVLCLKCYQSVVEYIHLSCDHNFCFQCIKTDKQSITCSKCKINTQIFEVIKKDAICLVCHEQKLQKITFSCDHIFCKQCLSNYWVTQIREGNLRRIKEFVCPECKQSNSYDQYLICKLLPEKQFVKILQRCPLCQNIFMASNNRTIQCTLCSALVCSECLQIHQTQRNCSSKDIQFLIQTIDYFDIRYCPNCDQPYTKDDLCDKVQCLFCHQYFCYFCMVSYLPIDNHGASRHRKDCRRWKDIQTKSKCDDCKNCSIPTETIKQFVQSQKYCMRKDYLKSNSAPGYDYFMQLE